MQFPHGVTVTRQRRPQVTDPMNPARTIWGDWADAESVTIEGAFVSSSSSSSLANATRSEILTAKSLFAKPTADVRAGDRITVGGDAYMVNVRPSADVNPFTGWQPVVEIPLELVEG